ncbi:MAG: hypothetical protein WC707_05030 [Candidatus Babeliaceae bacterium]|jgi:hypothetical protein
MKKIIIFTCLCIVATIHSNYLSESLIALSNHLEQFATSFFKTEAPKPKKLVPRKDFFKDIMGIDEKKFEQFFDKNVDVEEQKKVHISYKEYNNHEVTLLHSADGKQTFQAGYFEELSIGKLREQVAKITKTSDGKLNAIIAYNPFGKDYARYVDVGAMQAEPDYKDAIFQVASNFSTLEPTSKTHLPEAGITGYISDKTQGPFAAISAAPGLIQRMYYAFYNTEIASFLWRQTRDHQIALLDDTNIPVTNGYVVIDPTYLGNLTKNADVKKYFSDTLAKIKVGFQGEVQVTFGEVTGDKHVLLERNDQIINQVYTAAIDFGGENYKYRDNALIQDLAKTILKAAYEGTILAAIAKRKQKVVLTLIGGGVFKNPLEWIAGAIEHVTPLIKDYGLNVTVIVYNAANNSEMPEFLSALKTLIDQTGGTITTHGEPKYQVLV